jgi:hypothetical protein
MARARGWSVQVSRERKHSTYFRGSILRRLFEECEGSWEGEPRNRCSRSYRRRDWTRGRVSIRDRGKERRAKENRRLAYPVHPVW